MKRISCRVHPIDDGSYVIYLGDDAEGEVFRVPEGMSQQEEREFIHGLMLSRVKAAEAEKHRRLFRGVQALDYWATMRKLSAKESERATPPRLAEAAFALLAPKATVDAQLGDLSELHAKNVERHGAKRARWLYWLEVARAVAPAVYRLAKRAGLFGLFIDYIRTKFGL
ncbi:permease prefix domain 2-containing transporter [Bradyrhizobium sp. CCGE-LA001]|uniref:permease prefix domain 2-containing transporter n=1 Tax=Bradyrhizobium sp. CCGE-LA001 TaxID=1223566 RepID=UPI000745D8C8|nr:permease prefix domain 2-containing transporter [Bradyrhizobium sp. CCGE-LA001]AMA58059.1 hypothetical protein BCCGELA001_18425 [Bradyrhizobium sp. CCGE-LA001]